MTTQTTIAIDAGNTRLKWGVHDGARFVHDPVRLNVLIAAAPEAMSQLLAKHAAVRQLVGVSDMEEDVVDDVSILNEWHRPAP